jgi:hypothetical protein
VVVSGVVAGAVAGVVSDADTVPGTAAASILASPMPATASVRCLVSIPLKDVVSLQAANINEMATTKILILLKAPKFLIEILDLEFLMDSIRQTQHYTLLTFTSDEYI